MVLWITVCAFGQGLQSKNFLSCLSGGWNAGVRTHSAEAFLSCQMFSVKPTCTVRLGFSLLSFSLAACGPLWELVT